MPKLAEPIKVLAARMNPNGFKPKVDIMQDEIEYLAEILEHSRRLTKNQKSKYFQYVYENSNFTEDARTIFERHFSNYINR